ncbi:hypothetical protein WR25_19390 isoform G [Diploscapter pachys]|nr:hypothetical protein WR25_19390 isoform G [Diploscapter pachys]
MLKYSSLAILFAIIMLMICLIVAYNVINHEVDSRYQYAKTSTNRSVRNKILLRNTFSFESCCSQLGNQLYRIFTGYGIERTIHRTHIIRIDKSCRSTNEKQFEQLRATFPKLSKFINTDTNFEISRYSESIMFANYHGVIACCNYEDPTWRLLNRPEDHLHLNVTHVQNSLYFERYLSEIMKFLDFGDEVIEKGDKIIDKWGINKNDPIACMHIRRTDHPGKADFDFSVSGLKFLLEEEKARSIIIFGDDRQFMRKLSKIATYDARFKNAKIVVNDNDSQGEDWYISSKLCSSFLMTVPESTFGWFLAFFSKRNDHVYYDHDILPYLIRFTGFHR